jgi:hypothetical protein
VAFVKYIRSAVVPGCEEEAAEMDSEESDGSPVEPKQKKKAKSKTPAKGKESVLTQSK